MKKLIWLLLAIPLCIGTVYAADSDIVVTVTEQDSEGLTESDLDLEVLQVLSDWMFELTVEKLKSAYDRDNINYTDIESEIIMESGYVTHKNKKFAVFEIAFTTGPVKIIRLIGIKGNSLFTVGCISKNGHTIDKFHGPCGKKVNEVFFQ